MASILFGALAGIPTGFAAWFLAAFAGGPVRRFYDLRGQVNRRLVQYGNVFARARMDGTTRVPMNNTPAEEERLRAAEDAFRDLAGEMRAFANNEYYAVPIVRRLGYDPNKIASALLGYSNETGRAGDAKQRYRREVEALLDVRAEE